MKFAKISAFVICCVLVCTFLTGCFESVDMSLYDKAIVFMPGQSFFAEITQEDVMKINEMFNDKHLYKDMPSCGYGENAIIKFNDDAEFCLPFDECPTIYFKNKDMYFNISEEEQKELYGIISKYIEFYDRDIIKDE